THLPAPAAQLAGTESPELPLGVEGRGERASAAAPEDASQFKGRRLPPNATPMRLLGVDYVHVPTTNGGDLYVTRYGLPFLEHLQLENWREELWFEKKRERLRGTSVVYRIPTKVVNGRSIDLVVKCCRVGEDVPLDTLTFEKFSHVEFNSPYEEFSLVMELRDRKPAGRILTHRPMAIYVPPERLELWQTGRSTHRIERKQAKFRDVELDIFRQYVLIYHWVKGESADAALAVAVQGGEQRAEELKRLTLKAKAQMERNGFMVVDHKPAHIILRWRRDGTLLRERSGDYAYALIDFELLQRTPEHEQEMQSSRRALYLRHQRDRFENHQVAEYPAHLKPTRILDVDYVWGYAGSTHGMLWVVGKDPDLFDYFIPERWRRTPSKRLSSTNETYYTLTKDRINLVWKFSRVGEQPAPEVEGACLSQLANASYNSPFEEVAIALDLKAKGLDTVYPRAIYMSGLESIRSELYVLDNRPYQSHRNLLTPDGWPVLRSNHNYLTIWGFWNGLDEILASKDEAYCRGMNLQEAVHNGVISNREAKQLLKREQKKLAAAGYRDLFPKPTHYLLSIRHSGSVVMGADGKPSVRICNFSLIKKLPGSRAGS
ncbi:MAG TPA: hypothetical protein P5038_08630, partial [Candidatus Paceibacterota bacterium]|nr:hypothetical protein [Candidatus Paceibacterota bacterium]